VNLIHFVGKAYYSIPYFEREAKSFGVSRRVATKVLGQMSWGDKIWLLQGDM